MARVCLVLCIVTVLGCAPNLAPLGANGTSKSNLNAPISQENPADSALPLDSSAGNVDRSDDASPSVDTSADSGSVINSGQPDVITVPVAPSQNTPVNSPTDVNKRWIGGSCEIAPNCPYAGGVCLDGAASTFSGGMCTVSCASELCPTKEGAYTSAVCVDHGGVLATSAFFCVPVCDALRYPGTGCREGYSCREHDLKGGGSARVCLPANLGAPVVIPPATEQPLPPLEEPPPEEPQQGGFDSSKVDWQHQGAEAWRPLIAKYFKAKDVDWAVKIVKCESGGDPRNFYYGASGLFQHMQQFWAERSKKAGWEGADIFDPEANVAVAAWLLEDAGPNSWSCNSHIF